jgi:YegS/Rv2252/BmrU family lipid kinase
MDRRLTVIVNPTSGTGYSSEWLDALRAKFMQTGLRADTEVVEGGRDILDAVKRALLRGATTVVASGGDGTVSGVASCLVDSGITMGVLPTGTLNHFAKDLGIPLDLDEAVATIASGAVLAVDVGEVNDRTFINNSSLGLYPDIVRDRERRQRRFGHGKWRALLEASITAARRYPVLSIRIDLEGETYERRTPFVFVGNNRYIMDGFEIGKRPVITEGELALYVTQRTGRFGLLHLALLALFKRLNQARDFETVTARDFVVRAHHRRLRVATDGEVTMMDTPLRYRLRPAALRVIVPRG